MDCTMRSIHNEQMNVVESSQRGRVRSVCGTRTLDSFMVEKKLN